MKKTILAILIVVLAVGVWFFSRPNSDITEAVDSKSPNSKSNSESESVQKRADWPKSGELNQKITGKNIVHEIGQPGNPASVPAEPEIRDERVGKENPSMIEQHKIAELPPLDMMSTEDQIKFNKEIIMTPEEYEAAKQKISNDEIFPDVTEQQRQLDIEVAAEKAKAAAAQQEKK